MTKGFIQVAIAVGPIAILAWLIDFSERRRKRRGHRKPMEGKLLLRSPGYSLNEKREDLQTDAFGMFAGTFAFAAYAMAIIQFATAPDATMWQVLTDWRVILPTAASIGCARKLFQLIRLAQPYRLGFKGETAVGEELNQFLREGCHVFHDLPEKTLGNIDHIVVAKTGVFAIETKTRTKKGKVDGPDSELKYDGRRIRFPDGYETDEPIKQAKRAAAWLSRELTKACAAEISVRPVVVYPGWYIADGPGEAWEVKVRNPQRVNNVIYNERTKLSGQQMEQIRNWLDTKCRTVEF